MKFKIYKRSDLKPPYIVYEKRWWGWKAWGKYIEVPDTPFMDCGWISIWKYDKFDSIKDAEGAIGKMIKKTKQVKIPTTEILVKSLEFDEKVSI